jgi:NMD protein affecting ribosome stability and mRNA decay
MSSRYSNATVTKRIDRESGKHHTNHGATEPAVCEKCGAIYKNKRWTNGDARAKAGGGQSKPTKVRFTVCPACKRKSSETPCGFVYLDGTFFVAHREEIERLLQNEAERAVEDNPLSRVIEWRRGKDNLTVTTTTEHLAQRLGHALEKACAGEIKYDFSRENKLVRVTWHRE